LALGLPVAWVLARFEFAGRALSLRLLMLPFVVPTLVAAIGVLALWGPHGLLAGLLGLDLQGTPWLLLYGNLFFNLCLVVRAAVEALERVSARQLAAARSLGATPWRAFWRIEWPAIAPWLASSLCLVFLYCFAGFGLALVLGGQRYATVEVEIYTLVAHELKLADASALALAMLLLTGGVALLYAGLEQRLGAPARVEPVPRRKPRGLAQWLALAAALAVLLLVCAAPLLAIVWRALMAGPAAWAELLAPDTLAALWNTLRFSAPCSGWPTPCQRGPACFGEPPVTCPLWCRR
jgi:thiamine transport system permease protein